MLYKELAADKTDVKVANLDTLACPYLPICDPVIAGHVVRWNHQHLATGYAATLGPSLIAFLNQEGLLKE